jgi:hypothetical protein
MKKMGVMVKLKAGLKKVRRSDLAALAFIAVLLEQCSVLPKNDLIPRRKKSLFQGISIFKSQTIPAFNQDRTGANQALAWTGVLGAKGGVCWDRPLMGVEYIKKYKKP